MLAPTGTNALAQATNSLGQNDQDMSNALPTAQANATVVFANASGIANTVTFLAADANSLVSITDCTCTASSSGQASVSGTFVVLGGTGNVNVTISGLFSGIQNVMTSEFGLLGQSDVIYSLALDGVEIFSNSHAVVVAGANLSFQQSIMSEVSEAVSLQFNVPHTISIRVEARSLGVNEIPEPATVVLLVSGLGFMAGVVRKRRKTTPMP